MAPPGGSGRRARRPGSAPAPSRGRGRRAPGRPSGGRPSAGSGRSPNRNERTAHSPLPGPTTRSGPVASTGSARARPRRAGRPPRWGAAAGAQPRPDPELAVERLDPKRIQLAANIRVHPVAHQRGELRRRQHHRVGAPPVERVHLGLGGGQRLGPRPARRGRHRPARASVDPPSRGCAPPGRGRASRARAPRRPRGSRAARRVPSGSPSRGQLQTSPGPVGGPSAPDALVQHQLLRQERQRLVACRQLLERPCRKPMALPDPPQGEVGMERRALGRKADRLRRRARAGPAAAPAHAGPIPDPEDARPAQLREGAQLASRSARGPAPARRTGALPRSRRGGPAGPRRRT